MKILVVDDERAIRNSLKEILSDEGYAVDTAEDGATALDMAGKERYDVIFCDIKMPNMEGTEVLEKLKKDGIDSAVIMISGHGDIDTAVECIKKGAFDFIQKPLDLNRILITIKNATERSKIITENTNLKKKVFGQQTDQASPRDDREGGAYRCTCADNRPERLRQGTGSQKPSSAEQQKRNAVHRGKLRRHTIRTD